MCLHMTVSVSLSLMCFNYLANFLNFYKASYECLQQMKLVDVDSCLVYQNLNLFIYLFNRLVY
jgi:hypothetical protein